jgi:tetratricopeptide (TPR) repeat protein
LNGIGKLRRDEGRYPEAEKYYKQALAIKEKLLGGNDVELAAVLDNLGGVYRDEGRFEESEAAYNKALLIDQTALGKDHPYVGTDLNNLAGLYRDEKRYKEARPLYEQGLAIRKQALGDKHALVAKSYSGLAELESAQGDYKQALKLLNQARDIQNRCYLGNPHPDTATTLDLLGNAYFNLGDLKSSKIALDQCVAMRQNVLDGNHPDLGVALIDRARCEHALNNEADAEKDFAQGKKILTETLGSEHPLTRRMVAYKV